MDYTLLTAAHIHEKQAKMDAKREQEYFENAEGMSRRLESLQEVAVFPIYLVSLAASHIRALALHFSLGWKARKSIP